MSETAIKRVLIIDDDPFITDMYVVKFKAFGFDVKVADSGKVGIATMEEFKPDIILLDLVLPEMDGFQVLQQLKTISGQHGIKSKIILLTNLGQKEDIDRGMSLGADDYLIKAHFTPTEVVQKIEEVLQTP